MKERNAIASSTTTTMTAISSSQTRLSKVDSLISWLIRSSEMTPYCSAELLPSGCFASRSRRARI